ncbi:MAG: histidine phosphatase family protein [Saccharofermentanales bacterium]
MFYLIRHGETDYSNDGKTIYKSVGINFAPLTLNGIAQFKMVAKDIRLADAELIISSPYTRALQSAAILSKELQLDLFVEPDIFEWFGDKNYKITTDEKPGSMMQDFVDHNGDYPENTEMPWENNEMLRKRLFKTLEKYKDYKKVIVVCHGILIRSVFRDRWAEFGEIFEFELP